jgi:5-methylcytosine-specific restriction endonuclease McrA
MSVGQITHDKLRRAQELLGPHVDSGDLGSVLDRALDALLSRLEKTKFAATANPRPAPPRESTDARYIPASVKREVWERDGGRCTFVSAEGRRCESRSPEFDHIVAIARGGMSSLENLRLRCRAHNQLEAERTFGADFMARKRAETRAGS